mmetsp:Transcript_48455/g.149075  ORF Transcript_48455/g.149075 Transcript_48455/m.149075 type:complete len:204 (-) Transcript_48455:100-711(-)
MAPGGMTARARTSSSSVAYAPHTAEKGVAIASKVGFQMRRTVATTEAGLSNCWCILTTRTESGGSAASGSSSQREAPMRPPDGAVLAVRQRVQVLIDTDGRAGRGELDAGAPSLGPRSPRVRQGAAAAEGGCLDEGDRCRGQLLVDGEELYQCTRERRRGARGVRTGREPPQGSALADKSRRSGASVWSSGGPASFVALVAGL